MKNLFCLLLIFQIYNVSFSQEKTNNNIVETRNAKADIFKFHPNPADNELFVIGTNKIKSIEIIDVQENVVASYFFNKIIIKIDVSQLKSGVYFIQVKNENNKQETKKLIIK
ncbi:T9SS type A sorting domain-containing protein [Flavivirga amylovorans]|uniref:T9SS type A sorting domain-containing protein n=1 Tax=Flavivirga amylovorans TaxID=870486 RepID=A0ABT8X5X4_9FLAO|nr:T9SS type A sorting domain-containing protein [Flavivirga amylovorans]MDO5989385.1 T9SS type A sorting domain-containing protein [Flavivirga amylovorans]